MAVEDYSIYRDKGDTYASVYIPVYMRGEQDHPLLAGVFTRKRSVSHHQDPLCTVTLTVIDRSHLNLQLAQTPCGIWIGIKSINSSLRKKDPPDEIPSCGFPCCLSLGFEPAKPPKPANTSCQEPKSQPSLSPCRLEELLQANKEFSHFLYLERERE